MTLFEACYEHWVWSNGLTPLTAAEKVTVHLVTRLDSLDWHVALCDAGRLLAISGFSRAHHSRGAGFAINGRAQLNDLYCHPDRWGQGLSRSLHDRALQEMRKRRYKEAQLWAPALNLRSRRFYERQGWICMGGLIEYLGATPLVRYHRAL